MDRNRSNITEEAWYVLPCVYHFTISEHVFWEEDGYDLKCYHWNTAIRRQVVHLNWFRVHIFFPLINYYLVLLKSKVEL